MPCTQVMAEPLGPGLGHQAGASGMDSSGRDREKVGRTVGSVRGEAQKPTRGDDLDWL